MASYYKEPPNITHLLKDLPKSEITLISEILENTVTKDEHKKVLKIRELLNSLNDFKTITYHYDLLYWYCNIKLFSNVVQHLESKVLAKLKTIKSMCQCSKCKKCININYDVNLAVNLQNHICNPGVSPGLCPMKFNPRQLKEYELLQSITNYSNNVEEQLFFKIILEDSYEVMYFYTLYVCNNNLAVCLVCGCEIYGASNALQHISGQKHINKLNQHYKNLEVYHRHFANLQPQLQILQSAFCLVDNEKTKCMACNKNILFRNLETHLIGKCFIQQTGGNLKPFVKYDDVIKMTLYKGLLDWCIIIDNVQYPMLQILEDNIYCIMCNVSVADISAHVDSRHHQSNQASKKAIQSLKNYHEVFSAQPVYVQIAQVHFRRHSQKITCTICDSSLAYEVKAVFNHIESMEHKRNLIAPNALFFERLENNTSKSVSSGNVSANIATSTPLSKSKSVSNIGNNTEKKSPKTNATSGICPTVTTYISNTVSPISATSAAHASLGTSNPSIPVHGNITDGVSSAKKISSPQCSSPNKPISSNMSDTRIPMTDKSSLVNSMSTTPPPTNATVSENCVATTAAYTPSVLRSLSPIVPIYGNITETATLIAYDESVLGELYPDGLLNFTVTINSVKYPTIISRRLYKHCLMCCLDLPVFALSHAHSAPHMESLASERRRVLLKKFHDLWVNLPIVDQYKQAFFRIDEDLACVLCNRAVAYDVQELKSHIDSWDHVQRAMNAHLNGIPRESKPGSPTSTPPIQLDLTGSPTPILSIQPDATDIAIKTVRSNDNISSSSIVIETYTETDSAEITDKLSKPEEHTFKPTVINSALKTPGKQIASLHGTVAYSKNTLDKLYGGELMHYYIRLNNVKYPFIQNMGDHKRCLICNIDIEGSVLFHINSEVHIQSANVTKKIQQLQKYHHLFMHRLLDDFEQQYFSIGETLLCVLCKKQFSYDIGHVGPHTWSFKHKEMTRRKNESLTSLSKSQNSLEGASATSSYANAEMTTPERKIDKDLQNVNREARDIQIFNDFARKFNIPSMDIIQSCSDGKFKCLVCQIITYDVDEHYSEPSHAVKMSNCSTNIPPIYTFNEEWEKVNVKFSGCRDAFLPVTITITFCIKCGFNVQYTSLNEHLRKYHDQSQYELQEKLDPDFNFHSKRDYCQIVKTTLYRENIPQCNVIIEGISYPIIQNVYSNIRCLLCYKLVTGNKYAHLSSQEHIANMIQVSARDQLKTYHDTWMDGSQDFQLQQIFFEMDRQYYCKICLLDVITDDLRDHIAGEKHSACLKKFLIDDHIPEGTEIIQSMEIMPQLNTQSAERSQIEESCNSQSESDGSEDNPIQYPQNILDEFYPDYKKYHLIIHDVLYPMFRKTIAGTKCMICKRNPDAGVFDEHCTEARHTMKINERVTQNKLRKFHDVWMKQDPSVQRHQKYFIRSKCIACDTAVDYESIAAHVRSDEHERRIKDPINMLRENDSPTRSNVITAVPTTSPSTSNASDSSSQIIVSKQSSKEVNKKQGGSPKSDNGKKTAHEVRLAVADPNSTNILLRVPLRYKKQTKFLVLDSQDIVCKCCLMKVESEIVAIKEHLDSANHLHMSKVAKKKMKYYCEICNKRYGVESSWDKHLLDLAHLDRFNSIGETRKKYITEYECVSCDTVVFGDEISIKRHCVMFGKKKKKKPVVLPRPVQYLFSNRDTINHTAEKLLAEANYLKENQDKEREVCLALVRALKVVYPECKAYPFGSRVTGLGYADSDLDVYLDIGGMYHGYYRQDADEQANIVKTVAKVLRKHKQSFTDLNKVAAARTPIVQVFHKDSGIDCDISFKHGLSVENTALISLCLDLQPILRPTMLYLKEWNAATNISGISSYALTILMIFYLQTKGYLLSVKEIRLINAEKCPVIDGWETIKYSVPLQKMKNYINRCDYSVIQLMQNFFDYYSKFDFEKWVVCPLMGYLVLKEDFNGFGERLPLEMAAYVEKLRGKSPECFRNLTPMCVQDPFDLSHNLTKACSKDVVTKFQTYCGLTEKHISALQ